MQWTLEHISTTLESTYYSCNYQRNNLLDKQNVTLNIHLNYVQTICSSVIEITLFVTIRLGANINNLLVVLSLSPKPSIDGRSWWQKTSLDSFLCIKNCPLDSPLVISGSLLGVHGQEDSLWRI